MPEHSLMRRLARTGLGSAIALTLLAGCGAGFDPTESEPCEFFTDEELEQYGLEAQTEDGEDFTGCHFAKKPGSKSPLTFVRVAYVSQPPAAVADDLGLTAVEEPDGGVTHKGVRDTGGNVAGTCQLLAPIDEETSMLVEIGVDAAGVSWSGFGKTFQPCGFVSEKYDEIQTRIR